MAKLYKALADPLRRETLSLLKEQARTARAIAAAAGITNEVETVFKVLEHLTANGRLHRTVGPTATRATYLLAGAA